MLCRWFLTVCSEMKSFSPISLLRKPWATSWTISFSRSLSKGFSRRGPDSDDFDNARGQRIEINFFEHGEAVFVRHAQIKQKNVGLELGEELNALRAVLRFADNGDVFVGIEKFPQAIAKDRVVIG